MKNIITRLFTRGQPKEETDVKRSAAGWDTSNNTIRNGGNVTMYSPLRPGEVRTETKAMKIAAYFRAIAILSGTVGAIPLNHRKRYDGVFRPVESQLQYLLRIKPNDDYTAFNLIQEIVIRTKNEGNALIIPRWDMGAVYELVLISKGAWTYDQATKTYRINDWINGVSGTFYPWQVIHIRNIGLDGGYTGLSTIQYAARCLGISQAADEQSLETFEGGSMVKGMVAGGESVRGMGELQETQLATVADRIDSELRSGKNIIELPSGTVFSPLQMTVAEAKLLEHREFSVFEIARFTGVPPEKLFVNMTQNYKASEMAQINFLNDSINPIVTQIEQEFNAKLIPRMNAFREDIRFDREALLNTDVTAQADYYAKMHGMGVMTTNEIRAKKGLEPVEGGEQPLVSTNLQKLNQIKVNEPGTGDKNKKGK